MKSILVLTKIYPSNDIRVGDTPIVHYFAKEWKRKGYNVKVIHNFILFPRFFYLITSRFSKILSSKIGSVVPSVYNDQQLEYQYEGIDVVRIPIHKIIPHGEVPERNVIKQFHAICNYIDQNGFVPDVAVGHWWNPQLQLLSMLKVRYGCKTALILHDVDSSKNKRSYTKYFINIDTWGLRSLPLLNEFKKYFGNGYNTFHCASGIPEEYICGNSHRNFAKNARSVLYVGALIKRKHPLSVLEALSLSHNRDNLELVFIGQGSELSMLKRKAATSHVKSISFTGRISRDEVTAHMKKADIFVMISEAEVFGLVYLEAMGCGCITIASRNEGMEGIIVDGQNGFLCEAGNSVELASIFDKINNLSSAERKRLSDNAVSTASFYSDKLAAERYLNNVL